MQHWRLQHDQVVIALPQLIALLAVLRYTAAASVPTALNDQLIRSERRYLRSSHPRACILDRILRASWVPQTGWRGKQAAAAANQQTLHRLLRNSANTAAAQPCSPAIKTSSAQSARAYQSIQLWYVFLASLPVPSHAVLPCGQGTRLCGACSCLRAG